MITSYAVQDNAVSAQVTAAGVPVPEGALWVDLQAPTDDELKWVENQLAVQIPDKSEVWRNHILNRLYIENDVAFMNAVLITKVDSPHPGTSPVTFILSPRFLLTVHEIDPTSFRNFARRIQKPGANASNPAYMLEGLLEEVILRVAYNSEVVVDALDELSHHIFAADLDDAKKKPAPQMLNGILKRLGAVADLNSKINESLHSLNRMLVFFKDVVSEHPVLDRNIDILLTDTAALATQTSFLSDKVTFQLDATLGMINVEQNLTIKIFSVVAVFFLPPTLVSSLYGMNFHYMPELDWILGYPAALTLMFLSAGIPYVYFRGRGWL